MADRICRIGLGGWVEPTVADRIAHQPNQFPIWLVSRLHAYDGMGPAILCCVDRAAADAFVREHGPGDYTVRRVILARRKKAIRREMGALQAAARAKGWQG